MALTKVSRGLVNTSIEDNGNATAITIDSSENVGIGITNPSDYYAENLVVGAADEGGITIESGATEKTYLMFAQGTSGQSAYRGFIGYDHNTSLEIMNVASSGVLNFITGSSQIERMRIDASGRVTMPSQPTFNAYRNVNNYVFTSEGTFLCNATRHNVGNHFSTSTGRFTAPVAGVYHFTFHTIYYSTISNGSVQLFKNGSGLAGTHTHFSSNQSSVWNHVVIATTVSLNANDYIEPYNSSGSAVTLHGGTWNHFAGYLLG